MTSRDFCYWLQGFFELNGEPGRRLNAEQVSMIERHLALVFQHEIDPSFGPPEARKALQKTHDGPTPKQLKEVTRRLEELEKRPPQIVRERSRGSEKLMC